MDWGIKICALLLSAPGAIKSVIEIIQLIASMCCGKKDAEARGPRMVSWPEHVDLEEEVRMNRDNDMRARETESRRVDDMVETKIQD